MFYSRLSTLSNELNSDQLESIDELLKALTPNSILTLSEFLKKTNFEIDFAKNILNKLCNENILFQSFAIRCPVCDILLKKESNIKNIDNAIYCYKCQESVDISSDDIEVIYKITSSPFECGQQCEIKQIAVAHSIDILSNFLTVNDFNSIFYSPTDSDYEKLNELYDKVFDSYSTTTEQGNALEILTRCLFDLCIQYKSTKLRTELNDIDCFVRSKFVIKGSILSELGSEIYVECKNENQKPKISYFQKLQSIMSNSSGKLGIIVSKKVPPKTFCQAAKNLYLQKQNIIIYISGDDLKKIIKNKKNLLECIEMKACEIKTQATKIKDVFDF